MHARKVRPAIWLTASFVALVSAISVVVVASAVQNDTPDPTPTAVPISNQYRTFFASDVFVEINPSSSLPIIAHVSGSLPNSCIHLQLGIVHYDDQEIHVVLYMGVRGRSDMVCLQMQVSASLSIPIDVAALAPGDYTLDVMGLTQTITITPEMQAAASVFDSTTTGIDVDQIRYVPASRTFDNQPALQIRGHYTIDCPQIIGVVQHTDGDHITVVPRAALVESRLSPNIACRENLYDLPAPMPLEIPLDFANLPLGNYTLTVGDHSLEFDLDAPPAPLDIMLHDWPEPLTEPPANPNWLPVH